MKDELIVEEHQVDGTRLLFKGDNIYYDTGMKKQMRRIHSVFSHVRP